MECKTIRQVVTSAAEAETGGLFSNMKEATMLRTTLTEMGYQQPATPIQVDNSTACGIANDSIKIQRSKAIDMRFYWIRDRVHQKQFHVYWRPGTTNLADYVTKHHTSTHHKLMRPIYLHQAQYLATLRHTFRYRPHCEGVLIPSSLGTVVQCHQHPEGRQARQPNWHAGHSANSIATIPHSQQAYLTRRLII